jgi:hypothetical protein
LCSNRFVKHGHGAVAWRTAATLPGFPAREMIEVIARLREATGGGEQRGLLQRGLRATARRRGHGRISTAGRIRVRRA